MAVTILDHDGFPLTENAAMVSALAAVSRGECVQVGESTFVVFAHQDFRATPVLTAHQRRLIHLAQERRKAGN